MNTVCQLSAPVVHASHFERRKIAQGEFTCSQAGQSQAPLCRLRRMAIRVLTEATGIYVARTFSPTLRLLFKGRGVLSFWVRLADRTVPSGMISELEDRGTVMWVSTATVLFAVVNAVFVTAVLAVLGEAGAAAASAFMGFAFVVAWLFYARTGHTYVMFLIGSGAALINNFAVHLILGGFAFSGAYLAWGIANSASATMSLKRRDVVVMVLIYSMGTVTMALFESSLMASRPAPDSTLSAILFVHVILGTLLLTVGLIFYYGRRLVEERRRSETLLLNVLPASIAARLKLSNATVADRFVEASVLFADIVGFTPHAQDLEPEQLVEELNAYFTAFDRLVDEYRVEKIKTLGDGYLAVAGIPEPSRDHEATICRLALSMQEEFRRISAANGSGLLLRVGVHSGPVVAGIIGTKRFSYDLWGDTVNTASRMESHGVPGGIQVTDHLARHLEERFEFAPVRDIEIKGKGFVATRLLLGEATPHPVSSGG